MQVTFCPELPAKAVDNIQLLSLPNLRLPLYTHSFLGFGQEAALTLASTAAVGKRLQAEDSHESEETLRGMVVNLFILEKKSLCLSASECEPLDATRGSLVPYNT